MTARYAGIARRGAGPRIFAGSACKLVSVESARQDPMKMRFLFVLVIISCTTHVAPAQTRTASPLAADIDRRAAAIEQELLAWRRHLHQHPELSNREIETARFVADKLRSFGLEPQTGVART